MPARDGGRRRLAVVLGAGRSGTSLTVGVLSRLGYWVPQPEVEANRTNPRGFGEPRWVVNFHAKLMARYGIDLFDARPRAWVEAERVMEEPNELGYLRSWLTAEFDQHDRVVVKDPRTGWFLRMWTDRIALLGLDEVFIMPLRHPTEVLSSVRTTVRRRRHLPEATRAAWWVGMMLHTERLTRTSRRSFVSYDGLLADWRAELARVEDAAALPVVSQADDAARTAVDELVDPSLRRSPRGWDGLEVPRTVRDLADRVWDQLLVTTRAGGDEASRAAFDALREEYVQLYADAEAITYSTVLAAEKAAEKATEKATEKAAEKAPAARRQAETTAQAVARPAPADTAPAEPMPTPVDGRSGNRLRTAAERAMRRAHLR